MSNRNQKAAKQSVRGTAGSAGGERLTDQRPLFVAQPHLPPLEEFLPYLAEIWSSKKLTNAGPFHARFEDALCEFLGLSHIALFTNGTIALLTALQALRISGEVITTPYSFVATAHALLWNGIKPVFVDVDPETFNLDPKRIEAAITPRTTAILPVHCYGRPCEVAAIQQIADNYNLRVIYDAAHAFGVSLERRSVLAYGDLSVLSFHATKVFTTFEGGAIVCPDAKTKQRIDHLKNFGFVDETTVVAPGINGKMNEFCAALGILQLQHHNAAIERRKALDGLYRRQLADVRGIRCARAPLGYVGNYAYFPILVQPDYRESRDDLYHRLKQSSINARRYFYPLISEFPMYRGLPSASDENLPTARRLSDQVLCLPMYPSLGEREVARICALIART